MLTFVGQALKKRAEEEAAARAQDEEGEDDEDEDEEGEGEDKDDAEDEVRGRRRSLSSLIVVPPYDVVAHTHAHAPELIVVVPCDVVPAYDVGVAHCRSLSQRLMTLYLIPITRSSCQLLPAVAHTHYLPSSPYGSIRDSCGFSEMRMGV
jgi:hypothetical protein